MSGGEGNSESNTGLGHNGGKPSGNINGSSNSGSIRGGFDSVHFGGVSYGRPSPADIVSQINSWGGIKINSSQVSNIRYDGEGGYAADIDGFSHTVSDEYGSTTSNTVSGFSPVLRTQGGSSSTNPNDIGLSLPGLSVSHGQPGYWGYRLINSDEEINYYLKIFIPYGDSLASAAAKASLKLLDARQAEEAAKKAAAEAAAEDKLTAEQTAKDAEEARLNAELELQKQQRLTAAASLFSHDIQSVRGLAVVSEAVASPLSFSLAGLGGISFTGSTASALATELSALIARLSAIATASLVGPVVGILSTLFYSSSLNVGEDINIGRDLSAIIPGDMMGLPDISELEKAYQSGTPVNMPIRGALDIDYSGRLSVGLVKSPVAGSVKVAKAVLDEQTGYYSYALPEEVGVPRQSILVSPADAPGVNGPTTLTGPVPLPEAVVDTGDFDGEGDVPANSTLPTPWPLDNDHNDIILIFPADSGLKPIYIMYRSRRNMPGTVSGKGQVVGNNWLDGASEGDGSPIPEQVADKLRGKTFGSFDAFRRALWKAISQVPELANQLDAASLGQVKLGKSTFVRKRERVGRRLKHELHHKKAIKDGGGVYDIDNLQIVTPKRHIDIHRNQ